MSSIQSVNLNSSDTIYKKTRCCAGFLLPVLFACLTINQNGLTGFVE
ncbi:hypothetical protein MNB_SUP05-SYMBIONT-4-1283 [hydrothermal vent metagenome]|uniref:Uncharacterized protein n=1 Tax=hydrothermal vent metagenome TaxID=652676 RepID=A0A1W1DWP7_9ZZZZ